MEASSLSSAAPLNITDTYQLISNHTDPMCGGVHWSILKEDAPNRITRDILREWADTQDKLLSNYHTAQGVNYHVFSSDIPEIFSLGGDLAYFCQCAMAQDRESLTQYAHESIEVVYKTATNYQLPITTISLVKGLALGGGFEAALASNYIIAEEQSTFSFPEVRFGLFPGMGAYTFLRQRVAPRVAEEIIYNAKTYSARELLDMGIIDEICPEGQGYKTTMQWIRERHQKHKGIQGMRQMAQQFSPIKYQELIDIVDHWVDSVMSLENKQLRLIETLSQTTIQTYRRS